MNFYLSFDSLADNIPRKKWFLLFLCDKLIKGKMLEMFTWQLNTHIPWEVLAENAIYMWTPDNYVSKFNFSVKNAVPSWDPKFETFTRNYD